MHWGETEAIQLAQELRADLVLMDDRRAVVHARSLGLLVAPTIAIYIRAKRNGMVRSVAKKADRLRTAGFRLTDRDYQAVLRAAGEM